MRWPRSSSGTPMTATSCTAGCVQQHGLDLARPDPVAAALDQVVLGPADDAVVARRASTTAASPVREPAVGGERRAGPVEVAVEQRRAAHLQVADGVGRHRRRRRRRRPAPRRRRSASRPSPGRRSPSARAASVISVSVMPYRSTGPWPASAGQRAEHRRRQPGAARDQQPGPAQRRARTTGRRRPGPTRWAPRSTACRPRPRTPPASAGRCAPAGCRPAARPSTPRTRPCTWNSGSPCTSTSSGVHAQAVAQAVQAGARPPPARAPRPSARPSCRRCT